MNPVLISTDIGSDVDDALALLAMLHCPTLNISGIYTVNGKVSERCFIAKEMVDLSGKKIPVCCGTAKPLGACVEPYYYFEDYLVNNKYLDHEAMEKDRRNLHFVKLSTAGIVEEGVSHMANQLRTGRHTILSIGPLTNIAKLFQKYPDAKSSVDRIYVMGFRIEGGLEHNVRFDPLAAEEVLASKVPITIVPGDICSKHKMKWNPQTFFSSPEGKFVTSMLNAYMGAKIVEQCRLSNLLDSLIKSKMSMYALERLGKRKYVEINDFKHVLLVNFDETNAFLERDDFLQKLIQLCEIIKNSDAEFDNGPSLASSLGELLVRNVSIADAYIPYCFLHPERLKIKKMGVSCDINGASRFSDSKDFDVVTDLDYNHFERFLQQYLY